MFGPPEADGSLEFVCARPGATWLVYTIIRVELGGGVINTSGVNSVWARDLVFGAWDFNDFQRLSFSVGRREKIPLRP